MKEKGVSPVVGTILLIAITVALAAVVATLVGGLGGAGAPPNTILNVTAENDAGNVKLVIEHIGGDDLVWGDLTVEAGDNSQAMTYSDDSFGSGRFSVGDTTLKTTTLGVPSDGVITVFIIHDPTNQKIFSSTTVSVK